MAPRSASDREGGGGGGGGGRLKKKKRDRAGGEKEKKTGEKRSVRAEARGLNSRCSSPLQSDTERDAFPECERGARPSFWREAGVEGSGGGGGGGGVCQSDRGNERLRVSPRERG